MRIIDFVRLIRKHIVLLVAAPLIMASLVIFLTMKPRFIYSSHTTLYTGLATGSTVELEKSFNFSAASTAFDNLINVIKSRETLQEVSIRLLSQHLLLGKYDPKYISAKSYEQLQKITPPYIYSLVANIDFENPRRQGINNTDRPDNENWRGFVAEKELYEADVPDLFPPSINRDIYEKTVEKLTQLMKSSDTNFVYELLNYEHPHYSLKALSGIKVQRIANSDLVKVEYQVDDPGLSQQTLAILNEVCSRNYRKVRETRSDDVLKYFETQVSESAARLKSAEDKLLEFNAGNSFINYSEQSRAVATSKEDLEVEYNKSKAQLAGVEASIKRLEEKLGNQQQIQLKSARILEMKKQLGDLIYQISSAERSQPVSQNEVRNLDELKTQAEQLKTNIKKEVDELYAYSKTTDGMPASTITTEWINNVVEAENIKGRLQVMEEQIKEFKQQYASYVPAGANIKRIEREITVSEQQFLENLHGLNLARLKLQDNELASNIKTVDPPYYPLSPIPTKRKILVIAATILTGIIIFSIILISEYFDETLKNPLKASLKMRLPLIGIFPKVFLNTNVLNFPFILNRLIEIIVQNIELNFKSNNSTNPIKTILIFSTMHMEGKTTITGNIAQKLISQGKKVLVLNYSNESLNEYANNHTTPSIPENDKREVIGGNKFSVLNRLLGYDDPTIDVESLFLKKPSEYLYEGTYLTYKVDVNFIRVTSYEELLQQNGYTISYIPEYVLIELPPVLYYPYPADLIKNVDLPLLVCRSNRIWSEADQTVLDVIAKIGNQKVNFVLNGVGLLAIESVIGELPKRRSTFRRKVKRLLSFQFRSENQL